MYGMPCLASSPHTVFKTESSSVTRRPPPSCCAETPSKIFVQADDGALQLFVFFQPYERPLVRVFLLDRNAARAFPDGKERLAGELIASRKRQPDVIVVPVEFTVFLPYVLIEHGVAV